MGLDRQLEQLCALYTERSDTELLALHEQRDDLTDLAQEALAQVMKERRLSASVVPVSTPEGVDATETTEPALEADEVELQSFDDAFRLNEALRVLTKAEIAHRVVNWDQINPRPSGAYRPVMQLGLIVAKLDEARARELLQAEMNLFPAPEGDYTVADADGFTVLDIFSRDEALRLAQALGSAGLSFLWSDGREDETLEEDEVRFEVYAKSLEQAHTLVQQTLNRSRY